ncbi:MAG: hypothetical protein WCW65_00170 [Candidatus Paceibacterota bacterium]
MFKITKNKSNKILIILIVILLIVIGYLTIFKKPKMEVIQGIFDEYKKQGNSFEISECLTNNKIYYSAYYIDQSDGFMDTYNSRGWRVDYSGGIAGKRGRIHLKNCSTIYKNSGDNLEVNIYNLN